MTTTDEGTAATQDQNGGDPQGTGTSGLEDRNGEVDLAEENRRLKAAIEQSKAEKATLESAKRELEALKAGGLTPRTTEPRSGVDQRLSTIQAAINQTQDLANQGDGPSIVLLESLRLQQSSLNDIKIDALPEDEREDVRTLWQTNQFGSVDAARDAAWGRRAREGTKQAAKVEEVIQRRKDDEVATHVRGLGPSETQQRQKTVEAYTKQLSDPSLTAQQKAELVRQRRANPNAIKW